MTDYEKLMATSRYDYKTRRRVKDIVDMISVKPKLKAIIPQDIRQKYFKDYIWETI